MAVRVNANTDDILHNAETIAEGDFTGMLWFYVAVDRNDFSNIAWIGEDTYGNDGNVDVFLDGGTGMGLSMGVRNYNSAQISNVEQLALANWYHIWFRGSAATSQAFTLGAYRLSTNAQNTYNATSGTLGTWPSGAAGKIQLLMTNAGSGAVWSNARCCAWKLWQGVQLTDAQIAWERWFVMPVFEQANCFQASPLLDLGDTGDVSGNGRAMSLTGLQTEDGPPLFWAPGSRRPIRSAASAAPSGQPTIKRYATVPHMGGRASFARAA